MGASIMATQSRNTGASPFISDGQSADAIRKEFIETPMKAAQQPAIATALELLTFMSALPDAFLASEERELKRLARTSEDKNDPRIERLKLSIGRATELRDTSLQGKARIDRAMIAASNEDNVFHGFVYDTNLKPRENLIVRISANRDGEKDGKSLSATTNADGYFSISLGKGNTDTRKPSVNENTVKLSEQMAERLASVNAKANAETTAASNTHSTAAASTNQILARVEILDANNKVIHQDESPLVVNDGSAYREYVIDDDTTSTPRERNPDIATAAAAANTSTRESKTTAATKKTTPDKTKK
jgi:hypothetical protein